MIADFAQIRRIVETRMKEFWLLTPVAYQNVAFTAVRGISWVRIAVTTLPAQVVELGQAHVRNEGIIAVQCFVQAGQGTKPLDDLAMAACTVFENKQFGGLTVRQRDIKWVGEDAGWDQQNAEFQFHADEVRSW